MATKIILDPGHGGYDNGASYGDRREKDDVLNLAFDVAANLRRLGYEVEFTRTDDVYDSPNEKARIGNASGADYFISLHRNSSATPNQYEGVETLVYSDTGTKADMARNINSRLEDVGFKNLGVDERKDLAVLRRTRIPALLLEVGFINNEGDNELFDARRAEIAEAIATGIDDTLRPSVSAVTSNHNFVNDVYGYQTSMPVFADSGVSGQNTEMPNGSVTGQSVNTPNGSVTGQNVDTSNGSIIGQNVNTPNGSVTGQNVNMPNGSVTGQNVNMPNGSVTGNTLQLQDEQIIYQILVSLFRNLAMANYKMNQLINSGFDATANEVDGLYQVRVGAFETIEEAKIVQEQLRNRGYETLIVTYQDGEIR